jgi:hypothetical protein
MWTNTSVVDPILFYNYVFWYDQVHNKKCESFEIRNLTSRQFTMMMITKLMSIWVSFLAWTHPHYHHPIHYERITRRTLHLRSSNRVEKTQTQPSALCHTPIHRIRNGLWWKRGCEASYRVYVLWDPNLPSKIWMWWVFERLTWFITISISSCRQQLVLRHSTWFRSCHMFGFECA